MAIVNFSVPDRVKRDFDRTFGKRNKSAIVAELMMEAVERHRAARRRESAIDAILARRRCKRPASRARVRAAREACRP